MTTRKGQLVAVQGKFKTWRVVIIDESNTTTGYVYEVRKADKICERFDNEREAIEEMLLQDRIEAQNRSSDVGM